MQNAPVVQGKVVGNAYEMGQYPPQQDANFAGQPPAVRYDLNVVQMSCKNSALPPDIRLGFVKKVYGILGTMLLITFGLAQFFVFQKEATLDFFRANMWIVYIVGAIVLAQLFFDCAMSCQLCCGGSSLIRGYLKMMVTAPWNYLYLMVFSVCFGVLVGYICASYTAESVLLVFALTLIMVVCLTVYAVRTSADFTGWGPHMMVVGVGLVLLIIMYFLLPDRTLFSRLAGAICATIFGMLIVHDIQLIFGTSALGFGGSSKQFEYTIDMYAFAAWNLYLDFITFFLYMLQFLGNRDG